MATAANISNVPAHVPPELVFDFDIHSDPRLEEDVQGSFARAVEQAPDIFYTRANGGHWIARRYEAISAINNDPEIFSSREQQIPKMENPPFFIPLSLDPPENVPYRQALAPWFSPKAIQKMEPRVREWAIECIEAIADKGECDFIAGVSSRFPVAVFMELMGLPMDRLPEFRTLVEDYFSSRSAEEINRLGDQIIAAMADLLALRRREPKVDLISHLLTVQINGRLITEDELLAMCYILFLGGMDTVTNVLGFAYRHLAQDEGLQKRLHDDPTLIAAFVLEAVRCFGVATSPRIVTRDCERLGISFRRGEMMLCMLPIAGRDDRVNADPNRFDIDRPNKNMHLTFSAGAHVCLGQILARAELRIFTEEWVKRIPRFSAKPGIRHRFRVGTLHAIENLPLKWNVSKS